MATCFINNRDDNLRHCLYCLASEQLVEIGVSEILLCPLGCPAQAHANTHSMRKCLESPNETRVVLQFSSLSAACCLLLSHLGLGIVSSAQGQVSDCCSLPSLWGLSSPREHCSAGHTHLQLAHQTTKQIKAASSFPESSFAVTPQPVPNPLLCSLSPEMAALSSSGSTLQSNELKYPSITMTDSRWIYCLPLFLIFVLAFTS